MYNVTSATVKKLFYDQMNEWELARSNYNALNKVKTKGFVINDFAIRIQFNPARIQSSAAKVDIQSIKERKCFLCSNHLPAEQRGIPFGTDYTILVNPYPIFPIHFTIPTFDHIEQLILCRYKDMLDLAESLDDFIIFYNGPKCGASAPDHAHFQAGNKGFLPIENDIKNIPKTYIIKSKEVKLFTLKNYLRNVFILESSEKEEMINRFNTIYRLLDIKENEQEPMLNILTWYENKKWISCIFPREKHRPECFYEEGEKNILISPASVDMGGVFITPQEKDFINITANDIKEIYREVCITNEKTTELSEKIKNKLIE